MDLLKQVKDYRRKKELSVNQLANDIGISSSTLRKFLEEEIATLRVIDKIEQFMESKEENDPT